MDQEENGMLSMPLLDHFEELRSRIIRSLWGLSLAFAASLSFSNKLWDIIREPASEALRHLGVNPPRLVMLTPMEGFTVIWIELPLLCAVFLASPWIVYQLWAFISPGLYRQERRWVMPFVCASGGLFLLGGFFAYFVAFRFGLEFLLGVGMTNDVQPVVSISEYSNLFINVTLGIGLVFELPVVIFLLTLLHLASPRFLLRHSRYAILLIVLIAAFLTPTPDAVNLTIFAAPMCALYFVGIFFSYLLVLKREGRKFPWKTALKAVIIVLAIALAIYAAVIHYQLHFIRQWPYITR